MNSQAQNTLNHFNRLLPLLRELGDGCGEAQTLSKIGDLYLTLGKPQLSIDAFQQVLSIVRDLKNCQREAEILLKISRIYQEMGQHQQALNYAHQALPVARKIGNPELEAATLISLALDCAIVDPQNALFYYNQALSAVIQTDNFLGNCHSNLC